MRRRDFIALGSAAAVAGATPASAQQSQTPVVGFLRITSAADATSLVSAFRQGLVDAGFIEGRNIGIEYRWADGHGDRLPRLAADQQRYRSWVLWATIPFEQGWWQISTDRAATSPVYRLARLMFRESGSDFA